MTTLAARLRAQLDVLLLNALVLVAVSVGAVRTWALWENSLLVHPEWVSTKPTLGRGVMGALAFVSAQQALARNRLNLGAWLGFQEVLYADALELASMELRFRVEPDGYVNVLYDVRPGGFSGVRFSSRADMAGLRYDATPDGGFLAAEPLEPALVRAGVWHRARLAFDGDRVGVTLDGAAVGRYPRAPGAQRVGFRGGQRSAEVDDVVLRGADGSLRVERFSDTHDQARRLALALGGLAASGALAALAARRVSSAPLRQVAMGTAVAGAVVGVAVAAAYVLQYVRARDYALATSADAQAEAARAEKYWVNATRRAVVEGIRARYAREVPPGAFRLLVLGTSQTWGAGARTEEETWVRRLERLLADRSPGARVECVNAGVSGTTAAGVLDLLRRDLAGFEASAALVNLSNNDVDPERFRRSLEGLRAELDRRGIPVVFALEPNSPERRPSDSRHGELARKHAIVRAVAEAAQRPVVDLHGYLAERRNAGFLWWDFVHLTSFGQKLVAEELARELPPLLGLDAAPGRAQTTGRGAPPAGEGRGNAASPSAATRPTPQASPKPASA